MQITLNREWKKYFSNKESIINGAIEASPK